jgi:hypothetical protein
MVATVAWHETAPHVLVARKVKVSGPAYAADDV